MLLREQIQVSVPASIKDPTGNLPSMHVFGDGGFRALRKNAHQHGEDVQTLHKKPAIQTQKGLHSKLEMLLLRGTNTSIFFSESKKKPSF